MQGEHSAILLTCIKLPFVIKIFILAIFEWLLKTGFTACASSGVYDISVQIHRFIQVIAIFLCNKKQNLIS